MRGARRQMPMASFRFPNSQAPGSTGGDALVLAGEPRAPNTLHHVYVSGLTVTLRRSSPPPRRSSVVSDVLPPSLPKEIMMSVGSTAKMAGRGDQGTRRRDRGKQVIASSSSLGMFLARQ